LPEVQPGIGEPAATPDDARRVQALRARDELAFRELVTEHERAMLGVARMYVRDRSVAEEVVQEAWLGVLRGIDRFEGRSSLKTWIFTILTNAAKTRAEREGRTVPFSALPDTAPAVDPSRFQTEGRWAGHWVSPPSPWAGPEGRPLAAEAMAVVRRAVAELPPSQAIVLTMRDFVGFDAPEVCNVLAIGESNQRVLLHRARSAVRRALEEYLTP
jgi:RNA polymerase sigma-70 factor (ECF subfamily)